MPGSEFNTSSAEEKLFASHDSLGEDGLSSFLEDAAVNNDLKAMRAKLSDLVSTHGLPWAYRAFTGGDFGPVTVLACMMTALLRNPDRVATIPLVSYWVSLTAARVWFGNEPLEKEGAGQKVLAEEKQLQDIFSRKASGPEVRLFKQYKQSLDRVEAFFSRLDEAITIHFRKKRLTKFDELLEQFKALSEEEQLGVKNRVYAANIIGLVVRAYEIQEAAERRFGSLTNTGDDIARLLDMLVSSFGFPAYGKSGGEAVRHDKSEPYHMAIDRVKKFYANLKPAVVIDPRSATESAGVRHRTYFR